MTRQRPYQHTALLAIALCLMSGLMALAQSTHPEEASDSTGYEATQITGLSDAKPNSKGRLTITDSGLRFDNTNFKAEIPFTRMTSVSTGDVRIETGGKTGQIARRVIPFGGGQVLATITHKSADLLTIEYVGDNGEYHGVVFFVPKSSAKVLGDRVASQLSASAHQLSRPCEVSAASVVVEPIVSRGVELPSEYRVLLYEGLLHELRDGTSAPTYLRAGSFANGADCPVMKLRITVTAFKKGNQALRASTGPIGLFVGKTSVSFHIELAAADGRQILSENKTNSKRMDTESLGVAKSVAKTVAKTLRKLPATRAAI